MTKLAFFPSICLRRKLVLLAGLLNVNKRRSYNQGVIFARPAGVNMREGRVSDRRRLGADGGGQRLTGYHVTWGVPRASRFI